MPIKILSVDDEMDLELLLTQYFRRKIRKGEYEFSFAHNGLEALTMLLKNKDYDIILSDINMPEMDGLTLLTKINEMQNPALKCIMVSAYGDMGNIRQAMNNGAFDFATKPIDLDDLSVTIEKAIEQIKYIRAMEKEHVQLESLKGDLAVAHEIQQAILPRIFPPFPELADKVEIAATMTAAKDVGGDFYDFFKIDDERIGFIIADVSGKGIPAAIFMAVSRTLIRATALHDVYWRKNLSTVCSSRFFMASLIRQRANSRIAMQDITRLISSKRMVRSKLSPCRRNRLSASSMIMISKKHIKNRLTICSSQRSKDHSEQRRGSPIRQRQRKQGINSKQIYIRHSETDRTHPGQSGGINHVLHKRT